MPRDNSTSRGGSKKSFAKSTKAKKKTTPEKEGSAQKTGNFKPRFNKKNELVKSAKRVPEKKNTGQTRLNKYISNSGVCSRRDADELIQMGLVTVNGKVISEMGYKVNPGDEVRYENKVLRAEKPVYILLNKPKGYLTTTQDPQERKTVMHIIGSAVKERIYPVGRLDRNTTGLLLFTNDGELADQLTHPSYNVKKIYKVELDRPLTKADFQKISEGVILEEGRAMVDDIAIVSEDGRTVGLEIHIGWNRVVRRIFEALQYEVLKLDRTVYAGLDKKDLPRGQWRFLRSDELLRLKHLK
jgi:23S rRNA pseudouridine2605 synthase